MAEILNNIGLIIGVALAYLVKEGYLYLKKEAAKRKKPQDFLKSISIGLEVNRCLNDLRVLLGANSCHVLKYHNGKVSFDGVEFKYVSMLYESTDGSTVPLINEFQNLPASQFSELMFEIHTKGSVSVGHNDNTHIGRLHRAYKIHSSYKFRIGDSITKGSISVNYYNREYTLTKWQIQMVMDAVVKIESLMSRK